MLQTTLRPIGRFSWLVVPLCVCLVSLGACQSSGSGESDSDQNGTATGGTETPAWNPPTDGNGTGNSTGTGTPTSPPVVVSPISLGDNSSLGGYRPFPDDNVWNQDVSAAAVDPSSDTYITSVGKDGHLMGGFGTPWEGAPNGIPYRVVSGSTPKVPVSFAYSTESDPGPYPIPADVPIQGGPDGTGDRHVIVLDRDNLKLYEMYNASPDGKGGWRADSGAVFDLKTGADRPAGWTSADAAGVAIFPGLVRYDEVMELKEIRHALRFTAARTQKGYVYPARHAASTSTDPSLPPMGMRVRLKASYDISWASPPAQVILRALKKYGMILTDNGGSWDIPGAPDDRWPDAQIQDLRKVPGSAFEVVKMGTIAR